MLSNEFMEKVDFLEKTLSRLLVWIQAADTRVAFILPLTLAMLGVLGALVASAKAFTTLACIIISIAALALIISTVSLAIATFPRTKGPKGSMIYFNGIQSNDLEGYRQRVKNIKKKNYVDDLVNQIHINAQIAAVSYTHLTLPTILLV